MKKAFTLAEILITLVIIGVVAALTIPTLIANIQQQHLIAAWKETYSQLDQVTKRVMTDNGGTMVGFASNTYTFRRKYLNYMSYIKEYPLGSLMGNCWHNDNAGYYYNGSNVGNWPTFWYFLNAVDSGAILNNGRLITFSPADDDCSISDYPFCGEIHIDVNGFNPPNTFGKDIYKAYLLSNGIHPQGLLNLEIILYAVQ